MPTPIGHALGGLIVGRLGASSTEQAGLKAGLYWCAVAACLPDLDFLWGRHNMETHSLGFALAIGLLAFLWKRDARLAIAVALAIASHVLFDWLGSDDSPPLGVMALWPLSSDFYFANVFVFEAISRRYWLPGFFRHNFLAVLRELAILLPILALVWWPARRRLLARDESRAPVSRDA